MEPSVTQVNWRAIHPGQRSFRADAWPRSRPRGLLQEWSGARY